MGQFGTWVKLRVSLWSGRRQRRWTYHQRQPETDNCISHRNCISHLEYIFRNRELYQSLGIYFLKQCEVEAAVAIFVSWLLAELLMLRGCSITDVWIFPMSFRSVTRNLRVLPILKVYLLKLALKKEKEMLQKILELEAIWVLAVEACYLFSRSHHFVCCGGASLSAVDSEPEWLLREWRPLFIYNGTEGPGRQDSRQA